MKSELQDFISLVRTKGLLTSTHFYVFIPKLDGGKDLLMLCDRTSIPGMNLMTTETRVFGEITETPHSILYAPVTLSFYIDRDMIAKKSIDSWMNSVFDRDTRTLGFYDDYTRDVDIFVTDKEGNVVYCHKLREAYPKSVGDIQLGYAGESVLKLDVTLTYKWSEKQDVSATGESIVTSNGNLSTTNPFTNHNHEKTMMYGAQKARNTYANIVNESDFRRDGMGVFTEGFGPTTISTISPTSKFPNIYGNLENDLESYGDVIRENFSRASNVIGAALGSSNVEASLANQLILGAKAISRDMGNYGAGLIQLGQNMNSVVKPVSSITTSMFSLGGSLSIVNNALGAHGIGTPFNVVISDINRYAGKMAQVSTLSGLPGQLSGFGSALSATGSVFNETINSLRGVPGVTNYVENSLRGMGETFITGGSNTQNLAADINARVHSELDE